MARNSKCIVHIKFIAHSLKNILQEIVDREDWNSGNSINFIFAHSGPSIGVTSTSGGREAECGTGDGPVITIYYN